MTQRFPATAPNPPDLIAFEQARAAVLGQVRPLPPRRLQRLRRR